MAAPMHTYRLVLLFQTSPQEFELTLLSPNGYGYEHCLLRWQKLANRVGKEITNKTLKHIKLIRLCDEDH